MENVGMKKVAIIGANSYIARNLIVVLKRNYKCVIKLYDCTEKHKDSENNYTQIDIMSEESITKIDMDCNIIFMFVGKTGSVSGFDNFTTFIDINEKALLNVMNEYRRQNSSAKIIFPSTRLVYKGKSEAQKESASKEFKTIYAINKFACERYLELYNLVFGVQYCIFRICIPYGTLVSEASSYGTVEFMLSKARKKENISIYGDGSSRRTLTYIGDLCEILIAGAFNERCCNDVFNIGGENYSLKEMAELIARKYGVGIDYVEWPEIALKIETGDTVFDDIKLRNIIGILRKNKFEDWINDSN